MPALDEGDLLYMPTTFPGIAIGKARELLQQTDRLIATVPEVERVFGKIGRAETATDPAPLEMIETTIKLRPREEWRPGMTMDKLKEELNQRVHFPGLSNAWLMPIEARLNMLATGIKTPVGIKIAGPDLDTLQRIGQRVEGLVRQLPGTRSAFFERVAQGRYIDVEIDRRLAARFLLSIAEIEDVVATAIGGNTITQTIEGRERYPVNIRYPLYVRDSVEKLRQLPVVTSQDIQIALGELADIRVVDGPAMIKTENARLNGWVYVEIEDRDLGAYVEEAKRLVDAQLELPPGYSITWSGQYEHLLRAQERLQYIIPLTLVSILLLLYLAFRNMTAALMVLGTVPLALAGGFWMIYLLGYHLSVAVAAGFIALAGVAAEFGVVMLVYLDQAVKRHPPTTIADLRAAIIAGAVLRVRPKAMTAAVILAGLLPIMLGSGTGSEVMKHIAAPMVGGMITAPLMSMFLLPALYLLWIKRSITPRPLA
jgi:Cu(I)/Ag(I) efflux system membrane protein CusA/SilA